MKGMIFMELKKCVRCGCFFTSPNNVCSNCETKDRQHISKLNDCIASAETQFSVDDLAYKTGVSCQNISRFIENKDIVSL